MLKYRLMGLIMLKNIRINNCEKHAVTASSMHTLPYFFITGSIEI